MIHSRPVVLLSFALTFSQCFGIELHCVYAICI
jgi:hypothetical protein